MVIRKFTYIFISLFLLVSLGRAYEITYVGGAYQSKTGSSKAAIPPEPVPLRNITDTLVSYRVGETTSHQVGFQLPDGVWEGGALLGGQTLVITFPTEFDISGITGVTYHDTDNGRDDAVIDWVQIYSESVVIRFNQNYPGPVYPDYAYVTLESIVNSTRADNFDVLVQVEGYLGYNLAGPNHSQSFEILPGDPVSLNVSPNDDLNLKAGDKIEFVAAAYDKYGNDIKPESIIWSIDPAYDKIGLLEGSIFTATTVGFGRVKAESGQLTAYSGMLIVSPGEIVGRIDVLIDGTQFVGHDFRGEPQAVVYDKYNNIKTDFDKTGMDLAISSSTGEIFPDYLPSDAFVNGVASLSLYRYDGTPGPINVSVSTTYIQPQVSGQAAITANGIVVSPDPTYGIIPEWMPNGWGFPIRGLSNNPGNLIPDDIEYSAGYLENDSTVQMLPRYPNCVPSTGNSLDCEVSYRKALYAETDGSSLTYFLRATANYELEGETITVEYEYDHPIDILPFEPFGINNIDLPDTGLSATYQDIGNLVLTNSNQYEDPAYITASVDLVNDQNRFELGKASATSFDWPVSYDFQFEPLSFVDMIEAGQYGYALTVDAQIIIPGDFLPVYYQREYNLPNQINILPRAEYKYAEGTLTPDYTTAGSEVTFVFFIELIGNTKVAVDGSTSYLRVSNGEISQNIALAESQYLLQPGLTAINTKRVVVPSQWVGKALTAEFFMVGVEAGKAPVDKTINFDFPLEVAASPEIQVKSFELLAPNAPFVNVGQEVSLRAEIANYSLQDIPGPVYVDFMSDGNSLGDDKITLTIPDGLPAESVVEVNHQFTADTKPNPIEQFTAELHPIDFVTILTPLDNLAPMIIEETPEVFISPQVADIPGAVPIIDFNENFVVRVIFPNLGRYHLEGGSLALNYSGNGDFGQEFPIIKGLDSVVTWNLTAPAQDILSQFVITWHEVPIDLNTGNPVTTSTDPISLNFAVREADVRLLVTIDSSFVRPLVRGVADSILSLIVKNGTNDNRSSIRLNSIKVNLYDKKDAQIDASELVEAQNSGLFVGQDKVAGVAFSNKQLEFTFDNFSLTPGEEARLIMKIEPKRSSPYDFFRVAFSGNLIQTLVINGPREGSAAHISGLNNQPFDILLRQAVIAESLSESFKNYPNPFNSSIETTEIRYKLTEDSDVDITIFSAIGEKVKEMSFVAGNNGGLGGDAYNSVMWDGTNDHGDKVLNGVYIALIRVASSGETAKLKMAVIK